MVEKMSKSQEKPEYARPLGKFENIKAESTAVGDVALSAQEVALLDRDIPAPLPQKSGPIIITEDLLGAADPVSDISENVEYRFYQCVTPGCNVGKNGKPYRTFAGAGDLDESRECDCISQPPKLKGYQNPRISAPQFEHGVMRLHVYRVPRKR